MVHNSMNAIVFLRIGTMRNILTGCLLVFMVIPALAGADQPIEALQRGVEEGLRILNDPEFNKAGRKDAQLQKLRIILERLFDFREFSRRVLGVYWEDFTPLQRETFIRLFAEFLGRFYMGQLQEKYKDERLIYVSQEMIAAGRALVRVKVVWKAQEIPVDLRMIKRKGQWKIYDIQVLGISAVSNYRAQFESLLSQEAPAFVIERLEIKIEQLEKTDQKR
jgi:phospholipid transport system substrate-binding protein